MTFRRDTEALKRHAVSMSRYDLMVGRWEMRLQPTLIEDFAEYVRLVVEAEELKARARAANPPVIGSRMLRMEDVKPLHPALDAAHPLHNPDRTTAFGMAPMPPYEFGP